MTTKIYCPCCGRFIGECKSTDEEGICKATLVEPRKTKKKSCYVTNICKKCKSDIYIIMEFSDKKPVTKLA